MNCTIKDCIIGKQKVYKKYPINTKLIDINETKIFYIKEGVVKVSTYNEDGDEKIINILSKGDYIGLVDVYNNNKNIYEYISITDVEVSQLDDISVKEQFKQNNHCLLRKCIDTMFNQITIDNLRYIEKEVDTRIVEVLKFLATKLGSVKDNVFQFELIISKTEIASVIGIRRETFSRKLTKLINENKVIINSDNQIIIY